MNALTRTLGCCLVTALYLVSGLVPFGAYAGGVDWPPWLWPFDPQPAVVATFAPPDHLYGPGHRGIDLAGRTGQAVFAVAAGEVTFAGPVAGRGVVVVDHGGLRSTYQPVTPAVTAGDRVEAGQRIGRLTSAHSHCAPSACLHLGAKRGELYVDPLSLLGNRPVRLKPLDPATHTHDPDPAPPSRPDNDVASSAAVGESPASRLRQWGGAAAVAGAMLLWGTRKTGGSQARG